MPIYGFIAERLRIVRSKIFRLKMRSAQVKLAKLKSYQKNKFEELSITFSKKYGKLKNYNIDKFTTPLWKGFNAKLEKSLLPIPSFSFLNDATIMLSMFATSGGEWLRKELFFLKKKINERELKSILEEDYAGDPLLLNSFYLTSHTAIHHLYYFMRFITVTKTKLKNLNTIIEWGGGYGSLARLLRKLNPGVTYVIIDTPLFSCLQWLYLSTIFGEKEVNILLDPKSEIEKGRINLVALPFLENIEINADLFVSTWALSESSEYSQDYVLRKNWFDAEHLLLAYQDNPTGLFNPSRVGKLAKDRGAVIENMEFLPGNHYAFL